MSESDGMVSPENLPKKFQTRIEYRTNAAYAILHPSLCRTIAPYALVRWRTSTVLKALRPKPSHIARACFLDLHKRVRKAIWLSLTQIQPTVRYRAMAHFRRSATFLTPGMAGFSNAMRDSGLSLFHSLKDRQISQDLGGRTTLGGRGEQCGGQRGKEGVIVLESAEPFISRQK